MVVVVAAVVVVVMETLAEAEEDMEVQFFICSHFCFIVCSSLSQRLSKSVPY